MLASFSNVPLLDYFRVPYRVDPAVARYPERHPLAAGGVVASLDDGRVVRQLIWPAANGADTTRGRYRIQGATLVADVVPDEVSKTWLTELGAGWRRAIAVYDEDGVPRAHVCRDDIGNVFLPFDPNQAIELLVTERYRASTTSARARQLRAYGARAYYRLRPAIPRAQQLQIRRLLRRAQTRESFPRWPIEPSLHDLCDLVLGLTADVARRPLPYIAPWPTPYSWALVLTHDVETRTGYAQLDHLRRAELDLDLRSAWNFVPGRYDVADERVRELTGEGHEVGVHGLYHDGRDLEPALLRKRLPVIREYARRWEAVGFRSPALRRSWELMPLLGFEYDSSYPDTDPFGPDGGGCCSWLPFTNGDLIELPVTLPQDHTLLEILRRPAEVAWREKTEYLRSRGGMALLITHPDYIYEPAPLRAYASFLRAFATDATAWKALPREVSDWWKRRGASRLVLDRGRWRVDGDPDAVVAYIEPATISRTGASAVREEAYA